MTAVTSSIFLLLAFATFWRFHVGLSRRSTSFAASGPTAIFSMYVSGALRNCPSSAIAMTLIASGAPVAHRFVPSSGSTEMSTLGEVSSPAAQPPPTFSPM
jgi:hypothetical protein